MNDTANLQGKLTISLSASGTKMVPPNIEVARAFKILADEQRGKPESMFDRHANPGCEYSGVYQWAMEHTGDLVHRAAQADLPEWGLEAMTEKVYKLYRAAFAPFPIHEDIERQLKANWEYSRTPEGRRHATCTKKELEDFDLFRAKAFKSGEKYARAYHELFPYVLTDLQYFSVLAAISLGKASWTSYKLYIGFLKKKLQEDSIKEYYFKIRESKKTPKLEGI